MADAAVYREFRLRGFREHPDAFTSSFEEENDRPLEYTAKRLDPANTDKFWGAFSGPDLVGMIGLNPETRVKNRHKAHLIGMFVAPEFAGRGMGRALVNILLAEAKTMGLELIVLTVTDSNKPALALYQKAGFTSFGTEPDAIRVNGVSFGKTHMYLALSPLPAPPLTGTQP